MKYLCNCKPDKTTNTMENTKNIQLSEHFTLLEMTRSGAAIRHGIDNTPGPEAIESLRALCLTVLEPSGGATAVSSSPAVTAASA